MSKKKREGLRVSDTGAMPGSLLVGMMKPNKDAWIMIDSGTVPCNLEVMLAALENKTDEDRKRVNMLLSRLPVKMTREQYIEWCKANAYDGSAKAARGGGIKYLAALNDKLPPVRFSIVRYGDAKNKLTAYQNTEGSDHSRLGDNKTAIEFETEISSLIGDTLITHASFWELAMPPEVVTGEHMAIDLYTGEFVRRDSNNFKVGTFYVHNRDGQITRPQTKRDTYSEAWLKSIMQKLMRMQPLRMQTETGEIKDADTMLLEVMGKLAISPGALVPEAGSFRRGVESLFARLAVTIVEDAWVSKVSALRVHALLAAALLSKEAPTWYPSQELLNTYYAWAIEAMNKDERLVWDIKRGGKLRESSPITKMQTTSNAEASILANVAFMMTKVGGMAGDLNMMRDVANTARKGSLEVTRRTVPRIPLVHISVAADQHVVPWVAYFLSETLEEKKKNFPTPYSHALWALFFGAGGINPRRGTEEIKQHIADMGKFRKAQEKALNLYLGVAPVIKLPDEEKLQDLNYKLDASWLSASLGQQSASITTEDGKVMRCAWVLKYNNPFDILVTPLPASRDSGDKLARLADEFSKVPAATIEELKKGAWKKLEKGIKMKGTRFKPWGEDMKLFKLKDTFYVGKTLRDKTAIDVNASIQVTTKFRGNIGQRMLALRPQIDDLALPALRRIVQISSGFKSKIVFPSVGRDGGGIKETVGIYDDQAFCFFDELAYNFPDVLQRISPLEFSIIPGAEIAWWSIRDGLAAIKAKLDNREQGSDIKDWGFTPVLARQPLPHQEKAFEEIQTRNRKGLIGHAVNIAPGLGKTYLSMYTFLKLFAAKTPYLIFCTPRSAIAQVVPEIQSFFEEPDRVVVLKKGDTALKKHHVYIVEHDLMRSVGTWLESYIPSSFVIMDEIHKLVHQKTQRSFYGHNWLAQATDFVGMTGTYAPTMSRFLGMVVSFELNKNNTLVGFSSIISQKMSINAKYKYMNDVVKMPLDSLIDPEEYEAYQNLLSVPLGGKLVHTTRENVIKAIKIEHDALDRYLVNVVVPELDRKEKRGIFVVTDSDKHAQLLKTMFRDRPNVHTYNDLKNPDTGSVDLRDNTANRAKFFRSSHPPLILIPKTKSEGYDATLLGIFITRPYSSNTGQRLQLESRMLRMNQKVLELLYFMMHIGVLSLILNKQMDADSWIATLDGLTDTIKLEDKVPERKTLVPPEDDEDDDVQIIEKPTKSKRRRRVIAESEDEEEGSSDKRSRTKGDTEPLIHTGDHGLADIQSLRSKERELQLDEPSAVTCIDCLCGALTCLFGSM